MNKALHVHGGESLIHVLTGPIIDAVQCSTVWEIKTIRIIIKYWHTILRGTLVTVDQRKQPFGQLI